MKKIIGGLLVGSPFIALFASHVAEKGLVATLIVWAGAVTVMGLMVLGLKWLIDG